MNWSSTWLPYALASAFFAAMTAILGKLGVNEVNSNLATLIRTVVILFLLIFVVTLQNSWQPLNKISRFGIIMLVLSGIATGLSWLFYYRALQLGKASQVAPVDKLSVVFVILVAAIFLGETLTWKTVLGGTLITIGTIILAF